MIPVNALTAVFRSMLGWPYATPGSNDSRGIDCSGAFVYAYRQFGESIYHGSNRIIRVFCHDVRRVASVDELKVGMAIFKAREDLSRLKAEYKPGGRYYDAALPCDYYHMGLVTSVRPLEIINATPPRVRIDSDLSKWRCAGYLNAVDYAGSAPGPGPVYAEVTAPSGRTVNLRRSPSKTAAVLVRVPIGETVEVLAQTSELWWNVRYGRYAGYMMREFLVMLPPDGPETPQSSNEGCAPAPRPLAEAP